MDRNGKSESTKSKRKSKSRRKRKTKGLSSATSERKMVVENNDYKDNMDQAECVPENESDLKCKTNGESLNPCMPVSSHSRDTDQHSNSKFASINISRTIKMKSQSRPEETLRWCNQLGDSDEETNRIELYKLKRRERYRHAATEAIAACSQNSTTTSGFIARISVPPTNYGRPNNLKIPNIYAKSSSSTSVLYKSTASMSKVSTLSC